MAAPVNATINVLANTDQAVAQFRSLQAQVASLNKTVSATSGAAVAQQAALNRALMDGANASRMWNARVVPMNTAVNQFSDALDRGKMSLGQYTRYAASQLPGMSRVFKREFDMMNRVATENVKQMQTQYMALGRSATGAAQAMAFTPTALNKQAAATQIAAQRQMMMNRMIDLGTTKLLNWGKNTQWAGRQLMVGFSIPLAMMGAAAAKAFKEIDKGTIAFKRVYGDLQTTTAEMERNLDAVKELGMQYTKYGKSLASTIELSADVAATGARNETLIAATEQTIRLATLGLMEYDEALGATIALQTAFQISNEDLAGTIDFLNVVENETILTMQDMAAAIPRVAPVIKGLGGDVKDLAVFMTALREGGVTAEQGANALKSGLGRLINPTKAAREEAEKYGISIEQIVQRNRGDLMGTVTEFGNALTALGQLEQQQVLQKVFGTYQYARLGALFKNLSNDAGQAQRTMELTSMSVEDLAKISERELSKIEEATSIKFQAAVEQLKVAIAPIGETFMKALTPVLEFISKLLNSFNDLPDNVKNIIAIVIAAIAGIGPIVLMTVGLIANGIANIGKLVQTMRKFFARLRGDARLFDYLTKQEREAAAAANSLSGATDNLTGRFVGQQKALERLIQLVGQYAGALRASASAMPAGMGFMPIPGRPVVQGKFGPSSPIKPQGYQSGIVKVPGTGNKDTVPAMLTPGESVVTKQATQTYAPIIAAMNAGTLKMMATAGGATGTELPGAKKISLTGMASTYYNPGAFMLPGNQSRFGMDPALLTPGTSVRGINLQQAVMGNLIGSALVIEKELGNIAQNAKMSKGYFQQMANVAGPAAAGIADDLQDIWKNMTDAERATATLDDVMNKARPRIEARLAALEQTGPKGAALAQGARRFSMFPASRADLERYGEQRGASVVRDPSGKIKEKPLRLRHSPLESPIKTATKFAMAATPGTYALPKGAIPALPPGLQYAHAVSTRTPGPAVPLSGGAMSAPAAIRSQMQAALQSYVAKNPMWAVPPQAMTTIAQAGTQMGTTFGINLVKASEATTKDIIKKVLAGSGHRSPAPLMAKTGAEDGTAYGRSWVGALNKTLMTAKGVIPPVGSGPSSPVGAKPQVSQPSPSAMLRKELATAGREFSNAFRQIPAFAYQAVASTKPVFQSLGRLFVELNPWAVKAYDSVKRVLTQISYTWMGIRMTGMEALGKTLEKARTAYESLMSKTAAVWSKVTALPTKAKSAYETAMIRTMLAWDTVKRMPAQMTNAVSTFMSDLPRNLQRLRNQVFYRGQDIAGRVSERLRPVRERLARVRDSFRTAGSVAMNPVPRALAIATANMVAQEKVTAALGRVTQAIDPVRQKFVQITGVFAQGAQKISTAIQFMSDPLARAVAIEVARQKISQQFNKGITAIATRLQPLKNGFDAFVTATKNTATRISRFAQLMMDPLGRAVVISTVSKRIGDTLSNAATSIRAAATRFYESILWGSIKTIMGYESATAALKAGITKVQSGIISGFNSATQAIRAGATKVYEAFLWGSIQTITGIEKSWSAIKMATTRKWTEVLMAVNASGIRTAFKNAWQGIKGAASQGAINIKDSLINAGTAIKNAGMNAAQMVKSVGMALGSGAAGVGRGVSGWLGTVNEKTGRTRGQTIGTASNSAVMGLMGLSMAASFAGGEVGEMAQKIMPVTMGIMGLQMVLPMLTNPMGLAIIATTALVGGFIYLRKQLDDAAKEAANLGANLGGVANGMKIIEEATGFKAPDPKDRLFRFTDEDREAMGEFGSYFESEAGSKFIQDLKESTSAERYQKVSRLLIQGIASGLDEEKAKAFGFAIAEATGDALLKSSIARDFANQIFGGGSQRLIELEQERLGLAPTTPQTVDYSGLGGAFGGLSYLSTPDSVAEATAQGAVVGTAIGTAAAATALVVAGTAAAASPGPQAVVTLPVAAGALAFAGIAAAVGAAEQYVRATNRQKEVTAEAAKGLGFAIQTTQNLANAEAVLEEERRQGLVEFPEYQERLSEIRTLQEDASRYIEEIFSVGADGGAMMQALGDQLSLAGFSEDQIKRITERFNPDALAKQFFGEEKEFATLGENEKKYVSDVLTRVLSGLSPENAEQRLQDIEGTYKDMAEKAVQAMADGTMEGLSGLDFFFNKENITDFIEQRMGGGISLGTKRGISSQQLASNIMKADQDLKKLGTDAIEVFTRLTEFTDQDFAKGIMSSEEQILKFGEAVTKLAEYESINIEVVMEQGIDPDLIVRTIKKINNMELDPKIFGQFTLNAEKIVASLIDAGIEIKDFPAKLATGTNAIDAFGKKAVDSLGNIKPEIVPKIVANVFGKQVDNPEAIASALNSAFPEGLTPIDLAILLTLEGDAAAIALLSNPAAIAAAAKGEKTFTETVRVDGETFRRERVVPGGLAAVAPFLTGGAQAETEKPKDTSGSGGSGEPEKSFLEQTMEDLEANAALYLTTGRAAKKYGKAKADFFGIFQELRTKFGVPEGFIASLGTGADAVQKAIEFMQATKAERKKLIALYKETTVGQQIERLRRDREARKARTDAIAILAANGISLEDAKRVAEDSDLAMAIVTAAAEGNKRKLNRLLNLIKTEVIPEEEPENPLDALSKRLSDITDLMGQAFDAAEIEAADKVAATFFSNNTALAEKLAQTTGHTITNGYELVEAMERQVSLNERLINQEQDKIDKKQEEINDYERTNSLIQQGIEDLRRNDEIRNRTSERLSKDLEEISKAEEKIRESYQKRIDALDKVSKINDHLIQQQQKQLNLSRAISEGDIYAATQAAQEMRAASAQQAAEQTRLGLERGMEAQIESLTNAEGMTRKQIEEEINNIKEQNYQNSLLIRIEEDKIYANSLEIRRLSNEIYDIQENIIEPLQNQNKEYSRMLDYYKQDADYQISRVTLAGMTREQFEKQANALATSIKNARDLSPELQAIVGDYNAIAAAARNAVNEAKGLGVNMSSFPSFGQAPPVSTTDFSGLTPDMFGGMDFSNLNLDFSGLNLGFGFNSGGMVLGEGSRDSISAMLTPGEYVIRKAMVDKYGIPLMEALNQGSFTMPTYNTGPEVPEIGAVNMNNISNVNAPVYNTYDMKFSISGTNQSADEIANKVMFKMKQLQSQGVRSNRGY